jgi:ankyrin repeat protein
LSDNQSTLLLRDAQNTLTNERKNCVRILLAKPEIDVNLGCEESLETPLMVLARAEKPDLDILETLLQVEGIDVNAQNADGDTAAMVATAHGHECLVEALASGPEFDERNEPATDLLPISERTPLQHDESDLRHHGPPDQPVKASWTGLGMQFQRPPNQARREGQVDSGQATLGAKSPGFH